MESMLDPIATMQQRMISSISRSAVMVLGATLSRRLNPYFSSSELVLVLLALHTLLNTVRTVPGFNASWRTLRDLLQFVIVSTLTSYVGGESDTSILNLILVLVTLECIPAAKGWVGDDIESFTTSVSFIFSDQISKLLSKLHVPLFGAALSLCLGGEGLIGRTLAFVGINTLSSLVFEAISGGELSLAWPITLLYFVHEMEARSNVNISSFFNFGLYRASDAIYNSLLSAKLTPAIIFMAFLFLGALFPADPVWSGVCVLVFVQGGSDWFLSNLVVISTTDPVLAGLSLVTAVHFVSIAIESSKK